MGNSNSTASRWTKKDVNLTPLLEAVKFSHFTWLPYDKYLACCSI